MSILEQRASNRKNLPSNYADITGNIHDFKSLVPRLVAAGLVAPNQEQEALNDTRHPVDLSKALFLWDILLAKMTDVNLRVLQTIFQDTTNEGVAQLLAAAVMVQSRSALNCPQEGVTRITATDLVRIRDLILEEPLTYDKWSIVVDHVVTSASDEHRIKNMMKKEHDYAEGVLQTLQVWNAYGNARMQSDLLKTLKDVGLIKLADQIQAFVSKN